MSTVCSPRTTLGGDESDINLDYGADGDITGNSDIGDAAAGGTSVKVARADHQHTFTAPTTGYPVDVDSTEVDGTAATPARSDHRHRLGIATTKGDVLAHNGTNVIRLAVGSDTQVLTADSTQATGVKWATPGASSGPVTVKELTADQSNSTSTPTKVTGLDQATGTGVFTFKYTVCYQSSALTTGVKFDVNYSGTVTRFIWRQTCTDVSATASTNAPDQDQIIAAGGVLSSMASRAKGTAGRGTTLSVDTINADMMMVIEGLMIVTVAVDLQLYHGSENAVATTIKTGSSLVLTKTA